MGSDKKEINILEHGLVPEHRLLSKDEEEEVLEELGVERENLPKILKSDPVIQQLEKVHGDIDVGRMIKIKRKSRTAGIATAYRLVVKRE
ncbi:MAG: DNA-directed RNA polymerase subunit H [Candidatus Aenigmatarchaeota archaeon]